MFPRKKNRGIEKFGMLEVVGEKNMSLTLDPLPWCVRRLGYLVYPTRTLIFFAVAGLGDSCVILVI